MEHRLASAHLERRSNFQRGGDAFDYQHVAPVVMTARTDFAGQVDDMQEGGLGLGLGHEAAHAGHAHDATLFDQFAQSPVDRHARHAKLRHQFVLGGQAIAGAQGAVLDLARDMVLDLLEQGH